ncbi:hypothetical protein RF11_01216 [Thelohanellus kitauei]|uniref:Uncharacterized protein n=1 Tax=Thelohanellus kitauei TaxID=669202 RepID=A0A0C2JUM8_THEKT|nr:hypothetical protein RF11_01216 [Thelohanellus kitauei]
MGKYLWLVHKWWCKYAIGSSGFQSWAQNEWTQTNGNHCMIIEKKLATKTMRQELQKVMTHVINFVKSNSMHNPLFAKIANNYNVSTMSCFLTRNLANKIKMFQILSGFYLKNEVEPDQRNIIVIKTEENFQRHDD